MWYLLWTLAVSVDKVDVDGGDADEQPSDDLHGLVPFMILVGELADVVRIGFGTEDQSIFFGVDISIHPFIVGYVNEVREAKGSHG